MRTLPKAASQVLDALTAGLQVGQSRKVDNSGGTYMAVHVDRLSERRYSLAHYYEQNGDLVCDPDGVFLKTDAGWLPVSLQLCTGHYTEAVQVDGDDEPVTFRAVRRDVAAQHLQPARRAAGNRPGVSPQGR
jgi:hypothetical protein